MLVAGDHMGNIWVFDYKSKDVLATLKAHNDRITGISIIANNDIVTCSKESFINVFRFTGGGLTKL
jgi:WD40 repeat protein